MTAMGVIIGVLFGYLVSRPIRAGIDMWRAMHPRDVAVTRDVTNKDVGNWTISASGMVSGMASPGSLHVHVVMPQETPKGWRREPTRFWTVTYASEDGHWRIEPWATDPNGPPRGGWILIDERSDSADFIARAETVEQLVSEAAKKEISE